MHDALPARRPSWQMWALLAVLLAGLALRLHRLGAESLWYDETVSVYLAGKSIPALLAHTAGDIHPPGYYLVLHGWRRLTGPRPGLEFLAAYPSVWFGVLLMALGVRLARRVSRAPAVGLSAAALLAAHPYHIAYAQEVRMYTIGGALGLVSLLAALRLAAQPRCRRAWLVYGLAAAASLYTLYYLAFLLLPLSLWLLLRLRRQRAGGPWLLAHGAIALLYAPWLPVVWRQVTQPPVPPWREATPLPAMLQETLTAFAAGQSFPDGVAAAVPLLVGAGLYLWGLRAAAPRHRVPLALFTWAPLFLMAALSPVTPLYHVRYLFPFATPFTVVVAVGLAALPRRGVGIALLALLLGLSALSLHRFWQAPELRPDDHRAAVAFLNDRWRPGDAILINAGYAYTALLTYWPDDIGGRGRLTAPWPDTPANAPLLLQTGTVDGPPSLGWGSAASDFYAMPRAHAEAALERLFAAFARVWVYRIYDTVTDPGGALRAWLDGHGRLFEEQVFPGEATMRVQGWLTWPDMAAPLPAAATPAGAEGSGATLVAYEAPPTVAGGAPLDVVLYWRLAQPTATTLATSLRLAAADGTVWAQHDEQPLGSLARSPNWPAGVVIRQPARVSIPDGTPAGEYALRLVLYDAATGEPLLSETALGTVEVYPGAPVPCPGWPHTGTRFGPLRLERAAIAPVAYTAGTAVPWELLWRACADLSPAAWTPELILRDAAQHPVASASLPLATDSAWPAGRAERQRGALALPGQLATGTYRLMLRVTDAAGRATEAPLTDVHVIARAVTTALPTPQVASGARFGDALILLGYDVDASQLAPGGSLGLTLYWQVGAPTAGPYKVFAHLRDAGGVLRGQQDKAPGDDGIPSSGRVAGEVIVDRYHIPVAADAPPGVFTVAVGLYAEGTGGRLPVFDAQGTAQGDHLAIAPVNPP